MKHSKDDFQVFYPLHQLFLVIVRSTRSPELVKPISVFVSSVRPPNRIF